MMRYLYAIATIIVVFNFTINGRADQAVPVCDLEVRLYPEQHRIEGNARIEVKERMECSINLHGLTIKKIVKDNRPQMHAGESIEIKTDELQNSIVEIEYSAEFMGKNGQNSADSMIMPAHNSISESGVMLLNAWHPEISGLCIYKLTLTLPDYLDAVSESEMTVTSVNNGYKSISFNFPHPLPSLSLVAGRYVINSNKFRGVLIKTYLFSEDKELSENYMAHTQKYIEMYESIIGPFPYKTFSIVENSYQTGYSFPTYTLLGSKVIRLSFIVETSLGHEILHQWFGNHVYVDYKKGNWSEGLTAYLADHWYNHLKGTGAEYRKKILSDYMNYVTPDREIALSNFTYQADLSSRAVGYGKAAMLFHMLRNSVGNERFFNTLKAFINEYHYRYATWDDLENAFSKQSNAGLQPFFKQWLERKGAPSISIDKPQVVFREGHFVLSFNVIQGGDPFFLNLPVRIVTEYDDIRHGFLVDGVKTRYEKTFSARPLKIILDDQYDLMRVLNAAETAPVISAFTGDKESIVITPERNYKLYDETADYLKQQGYRVVSEKEIQVEDIKTHSIMILSKNNRICRMFLAGSAIPEGGCVIKACTNPFNPRRVAIVLDAQDKDQARLTVKKIKRYGNYSLLIFNDGQNQVKKLDESDSGIIKDLQIKSSAIKTKDAGTIDQLVQAIKDKKIVYLGESHSSYEDHVMQFEIIRRLYGEKKELVIGMEMFQRPFQKYIDLYIKKKISEDEFIRKTEYFTRWGYDYNLYRDIINFARTHEIPVIALNLRKEIVEKVAEKGPDALTEKERSEISFDMDLTSTEYRDYLYDVYAQHEQGEGRSFENFFLSQILWDEIMAHSIVDAIEQHPSASIVVLAGIGHLQYAWGIPERVKRIINDDGVIVLNDPGRGVDSRLADYVLFPSPLPVPESPKLQVMLRQDEKRVVIEKVFKDGPADKAGMKEGDVVKNIDNQTVQTIADIKILLLKKKQGDTLNVVVKRKEKKGERKRIVLTVVL